METDLSIRLHLYAASADRPASGAVPSQADALSCWRAATAGHSAGIICSHTRVLRDTEDEPELPANQENQDAEKARPHMPLHPGDNSAELLAEGAEGVIILKGRNG